jgi:hypothetical protein
MRALAGMPSRVLFAAQCDSRSLLHGAVFAERFQPAVDFAEELQSRRVLTCSAANDIAKLKYRDLPGKLSQPRGPIACGPVCTARLPIKLPMSGDWSYFEPLGHTTPWSCLVTIASPL